MSATKPISIQNLLFREAEDLARVVYGKPFDSLDAVRQARILGTASRNLQDRGQIEPEPGFCFDCGRELAFKNSAQCWHCHEGRTRTPRQIWNEHNGREVL
jgi:hypothetical protein